MLLGQLMQEYRKAGEIDFEAVNLVMDPGYSPANRQQIENNAFRLGLSCTVFESSIFDIADRQVHNPCFMCARMRRGTLYSKAQSLGCNKIALGHHMDDVIETTFLAMFYGAQLQAMPPSLRSLNYPGMSLIRPLYYIREKDIIEWADRHGLSFLQCACRLTEKDSHTDSKRLEAKRILDRLEREYPGTSRTVFESIRHLQKESLPGGRANPYDEREK